MTDRYPWKTFRRWAYRWVGLPGLLVILVSLGLWWNIPRMRNRPFIHRILSSLRETGLFPADPERFSVAVANLGNDRHGQHRYVIVDALGEFEGVERLQFNKTVWVGGDLQSEEAERAAHAQARGYLRESGADVLLWGSVQAGGDKTTSLLYWTTSEQGKRATNYYRVEDFKLPEIFWSDLTDVLGLVVLTQSAAFFGQGDRVVADRLSAFIEKVRALLEESSGRADWSADDVARARFILGGSLLVLGERSGTKGPLEAALAAYGAVLREWPRDRAPLDRAATQNNLGVALSLLGERESGTARLEEAIGVLREALEVRTKERVPLDWAATQNNLGIALSLLGERESGTARLEEAIGVLREALQARTKERVPFDWATTQNNLGEALSVLGVREPGTARLEEAVAAYGEALTELTRERLPLEWAGTRSNLGCAFREIGARTSNAALVCDAVGRHAEAWEVLSSQGHFRAATARSGAEKDVAALETEFTPEAYRECLATHQEALGRMALTGGESPS